MSDHPFVDLAGQVGRIFVLAMAIAAFVAVPLLLVGGLLGLLLLATMVFTWLAFVQLARALASRSFHEPVWRTGLRGNPVLIGMLAAALALQLAVVYLPFAQEIFGTTALTLGQLAVGFGLALAILVLMEIEKALRGRSTPSASERRQLAADLV
jgi:magnesium-transporting ATPase (P-type)